VLEYSEDLKNRSLIFDKLNDSQIISDAGTFSFGDFDRMETELAFKGNFYEKVKRKSLVIREALDSKRKVACERASSRGRLRDLQIRNTLRKLRKQKQVENADLASLVKLARPKSRRRKLQIRQERPSMSMATKMGKFTRRWDPNTSSKSQRCS